mgnify:CR=1 FL=1
MTDDNTFHLFNLQTMSGVHPGSRTARVHILRLQAREPAQDTLRWGRLLWPDDSDEWTLYLQAGPGWSETPFLQGSAPAEEEILAGLLERLADAGQQPLVCATCCRWQPIRGEATPDGIAVGLCTWTAAGNLPNGADPLRKQCGLALACPHWQTGVQPPEREAEPLTAEPPAPPKEGMWASLLRRVGLGRKRFAHTRVGNVVERSGVGAGTERCLACHGRIANLGALTVAAEGDDKRTISVWRCRYCHSYYVNDWIDRWERLDSLETEESYYRIAPDEALSLLSLFRNTAGGEHPKERRSRTAERAQVDAFLADRPRLVHQVKQGR